MAENMDMNMNNNMNYAPQYVPAPEQKKSGGWAWLVVVLLGVALLVLGIILYNVNDRDKYFKTKDIHETYSVSDIDDIKMDMPFADLTIEKSKDNMIHIDAVGVPEQFNSKAENGKFTTSFKKKKIGLLTVHDFFSYDENKSKITIALPDKEYKNFDLSLGAGETSIGDLECGFFNIDCGAGEITFKNISCESGDIDCGAGELNISDMNCKGELKIDGGAGEVTIIDTTLGGLDLDHGVGEFTFTGTINGDIDADGGVGEMSINLTNPESDFSKNGGKYKLDVDHGIGSANVTYNN
ncbi:DUF4097 family beta strand repeat-containing protein [Ruminococcus flavefaciens]|uniref:DUF4097 family beta strand repeat-containing protein n=1 Tax=Ruminococcus flavefaciens TaxID=1265 RepID=UPI0026EA4768|nr:DUF4097 family beta strand repeat-containing protein [Ruminococcus flavefaciens]MDD7516950.1 DUF4097 family beta strand repeat-containing protein [Ruminococcus flavefaciens]MDY5693050.1 DUF4097 family beta strand repeat-containing protein [Ruminococcus flavefaciens]